MPTPRNPPENRSRAIPDDDAEDGFDASTEKKSPADVKDEGPLESLGKAITAPIVDADDEADETPDRS